MERGYTQNRLKISYEFNVPEFRMGLSLDNNFRQYSSHVLQDELHNKREHLDQTFSLWFGFKFDELNQKIILSHRMRETESPYKWVEDLKTFNQFIVEYTVYFNNIGFK